MLFGRLYILIAIGAILVGVVGWKIHSLNNTIEERDKTIVELKTDNDKIREELTICKLAKSEEENNRLKLQKSITEANSLVTELKEKNNALVEEYEQWKTNKPESKASKVIIKYRDSKTCEDILKFNKELGELKYEDL